MKRILFLVLIAFAFSPAVETSSSQSTGQGQNSRINLSGIWEDAGDQVTIADTRGSVTARYSKQKQCRHEGSVTPYTSGFIVTGSGSTLTGTGTICYYGERDPDSPAPRGVKQDSTVTLTVGADGNTLTGTQVGYHGSISFTLKRKCQTDTAPGITESAGFIFINPPSRRAVSRSGPTKSCPEVGTLPNGARLVYRRVVFNEETGAPDWYLVEPPGGTPGWIPAGDTSPTRPVTPIPTRPIRIIPDSGDGSISASPTAGGRARPNTSSGNRRGPRRTRATRRSNRP